MKVLLVSVKSTRAHGGIAMWTQRYLSLCDAHNVACVLVNTETVGRRAETSTARRSLRDELVRTKRIFADLKSALREDCDTAHLNTSCGTFGLFRDYWIARRIKKKGLPLTTQYHCDIPAWVKNPVSRMVLGKLVSCSDRNLVLCESSRKYLQTQFGADALTIPNFVEAQLVRTEKPIRPQIEQVVCVGRVEQEKGAAELYALAEQFPGITFTLAGEASAQVADWEKPENVILTGVIPNGQVIAQLDNADLFLLPSHTEGCSVALLEAMARGVPCVATDVGANRELLDGCGVIVSKNDVPAMAAAMRRLDDPHLRKQLSQSAVQRVQERYTQHNAEKLIMKI